MRTNLLLTVLLVGNAVHLAYAQQGPEKLSTMSVEDLLNLQVTSVSKIDQKLSQTASAIYVITQEDIERSGATKIPDLLRIVPGMDVGQINANTWAISARGSNRRYADELMVLLDGRSIYLTSFGGVYWDVLDLPLEDIERIEVIRGPGGSIWGANAVNGVINIITKKAGETKGAMLVAGGGNLDEGFGTVQYGGTAGKATDYRIYSKYFAQNQLPSTAGGDGADGWNLLRGGLRVDGIVSNKDKLTFQGDVYTGRVDQSAKILSSLASSLQLVGLGMNLSGGFFQAAWSHEFSTRSESSLEISYNRNKRGNIVEEAEGVANLDFQHEYRWRQRQDLVAGISLYNAAVNTNGALAVSFNPPDVTVRFFSFFAQDEIAVAPNRLYLTIGARLEHHYYNGFSLMPTVRAAWKLSEHHTVWAAVSRAIDTSDLNETEIRLNFNSFSGPNGTLFVPARVGNPKLMNEFSLDYETGYRSTLTSKISIDLAAYYNHNTQQSTVEPATPFFESEPTPPHIVIPTTYQNLMHGEAHGIEGFANWKVSDRLTLSPGYAFERIHMHLDPSSQDRTAVAEEEGSTPVNSAQLRAHLSLPHALAGDASAYFVGRIADPFVPSYTRIDAGLTWQAGERLSFSVFGQNLLREQRLEYLDELRSTASTLVKRGAYAKVRWVL